LAVLYLDVSIESIESELVSGNSIVTGVANDLHLLGRKNHPELFKELETYNEAKRRDKNAHIDYMQETSVLDNLSMTQMVDKTLPFLAAIDPVVTFALFMNDIFAMKDT
jgi:hypothetical protein